MHQNQGIIPRHPSKSKRWLGAPPIPWIPLQRVYLDFSYPCTPTVAATQAGVWDDASCTVQLRLLHVITEVGRAHEGRRQTHEGGNG